MFRVVDDKMLGAERANSKGKKEKKLKADERPRSKAKCHRDEYLDQKTTPSM